MSDSNVDTEYAEQQLAFQDTIAWDNIYARACRQAHDSGYAQLILEHGPPDYALIDGSGSGALRLKRLRGAKVHVILDW